MFLYFLACSPSRIAQPINVGLTKFYREVAQKKDKDITPLERFVVRSTFHHMSAVGDLLYPESSLIIKYLLYSNIDTPKNANRKTRSKADCLAQKTPKELDTTLELPSGYFRKAKKLRARINKLSLGIHFDAFTAGSVEKRVLYAYNPVCYDIRKSSKGKKVRAYIWMNWSKNYKVATPLQLGPFLVAFPDSLIHVAGPAIPYYAVSEWEL